MSELGYYACQECGQMGVWHEAGCRSSIYKDAEGPVVVLGSSIEVVRLEKLAEVE